MRMIITFLVLFFATFAQAYVVPTYRDLKPASQDMLEKQDFGLLAAASTAYVKATYAGNTSTAAVTLSSFLAQPDAARNVVITPGGSTGDVASCTVVVSGTDFLGDAVSEDFAFAANATVATVGAKAFKTVSSIVFPANCEDSPFNASWDVGIGEKIGIKRCMNYEGDWAWSSAGGTYESTRATVVANSSTVSMNTADFNGTMNGSNRFIGRFVQNFQCLP